MKPTEFSEQNKVFTKPENMTDEQCLPLPVWHGTDQAGFPLIISCWKPTEEEINQIKETGVIWLSIVGKGMPPVSLTTESPFVVKPQTETT